MAQPFSQTVGTAWAGARPFLLYSLFGLTLVGFFWLEKPLWALLFVCALPVLALLMRRPTLGIFLIVVSTPFETFLSSDFLTIKAIKLGLVGLIAALLFLQHLGRNREKLVIAKTEPYSWFFALMIVSALLATLTAPSPSRSALGVAQIGLAFFYYWQVRTESLPLSFAAKLLRLIIWVAVPVAALGIAQTLLGYSSFLGSAEQQATEALGGDFTPLGLERASGLFGSSNAAGCFFAATALLAGLHAMVFRRHRIAYWMITGLLVLALLSTFSRGAILAALCSCLFFLAASQRVKSRLKLAAALVGLVVTVFLVIPQETLIRYFRLESGDVIEAGSRTEVWGEGLALIRQHPLTGVGLYGFQEEAEKMKAHGEAAQHPHNGLLKALVEQGFLGGIAYLLLAISFLRISLDTLRRGVSAGREYYWIFAAIACVGICLFGQELVDAGFTVGGSSMAVLFVTLLAIQTSTRDTLARDSAPAHRPSRRIAQWAPGGTAS